jgi:hypothetical protein
MAALATQQLPITGLAPAYSAAGGSGDTVAPGDHVVLHVKNGSGGSINVTVAVPGTEYGQNRPDPVVAVAAGADKFLHLPREIADPTDGRIHVTYSAVTTVTVAALSL